MFTMWYLTSDTDPRVLYIIPHLITITIGRSSDPEVCDFSIQNDASISRKHASMVAQDSGLFVKDLGSKYGTTINSSAKLDANKYMKLFLGDTIKFGILKSVWKVNEGSFVTSSSTLKGENLMNVKLNLLKFGGILKIDWDDTCGFLTMPAITLTMKVLLALVQQSYIVTTEFWEKCLEAINSKAPLPDPEKYTPDILEPTLNKDIVSFLPNKNRTNLFDGKKFIFFSKRQFAMYETVLMKSSATPFLLSHSNFTKAMLCEDGIVVIHYLITSTRQQTEPLKKQITEITSYMKTRGKRVVPEAEIGLAILYCSTAKYCNAEYNLPSEIVNQEPAQSSNKVLAHETQDIAAVNNYKPNIIINESLGDDHTLKRKLSETLDDETQTNACEKLAKDVEKVPNESSKRKHTEDKDNLANPSKKIAVEQDVCFNFITPASNSVAKDNANTLNLVKPLKKKAGFDADEELFNFVQDDKSTFDSPKRSMFEEIQTESKTTTTKTEQKMSPQDIAAMRGSKLDELKSNHLNLKKSCNIKKDIDDDDLHENINLPDMSVVDPIGSITVKVKTGLIVKKEPLKIEAQDSQVKNFKMFKKVWPLKMQVTVFPKSSKCPVIAEDPAEDYV